MEAFMYLVGYDRKFGEFTNSGWGCGYVAIKEDHKLVKDYIANIAKQVADNDAQSAINPDYFGWIDNYLSIPEFSQEITYTEWKTINGIKYLVVGFDTAHSYNNPETNTHDWVLSQTVNLLNIVNSHQ